MEVIIALVIVVGVIWFALAKYASRRDENGMDAQDRYYHRKAMDREMVQQAAQAGVDAAIGYTRNEQRLMDQGLTAEQAVEVSRTRTSRHGDEGHAGPLWECTACDEAAKNDVEMERLLHDDPDQLLAMLEESERALAKAGIVRRPEAQSNREMLEELHAKSGHTGTWAAAHDES